MSTNPNESKEIKFSPSDVKKIDEDIYCIDSRSEGGQESIGLLNRIAQTATGSDLKKLFVIAITSDGKIKSLLANQEDDLAYLKSRNGNTTNPITSMGKALTSQNTPTPAFSINATSGQICFLQADGSFKCYP